MRKSPFWITFAIGVTVLAQGCGKTGPVATNPIASQTTAPVPQTWAQGYLGFWATDAGLFEVLSDGNIHIIYSALRARELQPQPVMLIHEGSSVFLVTESNCSLNSLCRDRPLGGTDGVRVKTRELLRFEADGNLSLIETQVSGHMGKVNGTLRRVHRNELQKTLEKLKSETPR